MSIKSIKSIKLKSTTKVSVECLRLDQENPRLIGSTMGTSDEAIIAQFYRAAELDELLQSISTNGYLDIEPLIAVSESDNDNTLTWRSVGRHHSNNGSESDNDNTLTVLEGNRRLAAIRLFREADLANRIAWSEKLRIEVPQINDSLRSTLDEVSVYRVASRDNARSFIGFKHINGAAKWDSYAKARFAANWYEQEKSKGVTLQEIAKCIGDRHDTIKRMVYAIYVLDQAKAKERFDLDDRNTSKFSFSHLYTALSRSQYMDYLGLNPGWTAYEPCPDPVPKNKLDELEKMLVWIYGSKAEDAKPVVQSQNPDIKRLGEVLANAEGIHVLEVTRDLNMAHASIEAVDSRFRTSLIRARDALGDVASSLRAYDGRDLALLDIAEDAKELAETVYLRMSKKRRDAVSEL